MVLRELKSALANNKKAKAAYAVMGRGMQREYAEYISVIRFHALVIERHVDVVVYGERMTTPASDRFAER